MEKRCRSLVADSDDGRHFWTVALIKRAVKACREKKKLIFLVAIWSLVHDVWWEYGELYAITCLQSLTQYVQIDRVMNYCGRKRIFALLAWKVIWEGNARMKEVENQCYCIIHALGWVNNRAIQKDILLYEHLHMQNIIWLKHCSQSTHKATFISPEFRK